MKAMVIREFGSPDVFEPTEVPTPEAGPGEVLIRVAASSMNPVDWKIRSGTVPQIAPQFPAILHGDVAGTVESVGQGVTRFQPGDEVYGCAGGFKGIQGALAEFMVADADLIAKKPVTLSLLDAAALPLVSITAWLALVERAKIKPGQKVLVHGGCGGVGHIGIQLARQCGAIVHTTVSSEEKATYAGQLGADVTINYREESVEDYVQKYTDGKGFDLVFDTVGEDNLMNSLKATKVSGTLATIAARTTLDLTLLHGKDLTFNGVLMLVPILSGRGRAQFAEILELFARMIERGRICPLLDEEVIPFTEVAAAHKKLEANQARGKIRLMAKFN